jgi:hypothetical protein
MEVAWLAVAVLSLIVTSAILGYKGQRSWLAVALSLALGPVGIVAALMVPDKRPVAAPQWKRCPFCAETIRREAMVCKHCGRDLAHRP